MQNMINNVADHLLGHRETESPMQPKVDESRPMHSLIWNGASDVRCVEKPRPLLTDPRDVVLKITATSICGSDLHMYSGNLPFMRQGDIMGHEFMGVIEEVGTGVGNLKLGQRVVVAFGIACGSCAFCQREEYTGCRVTNPSNLSKEQFGQRTSAIFGYSHITGGVPGGQAQYVRVPFADVNCLPIPDEISDQRAFMLSDVVPTSYHGTETAKVGKGDTVVIWGLGPIGLMAARWCQIRGAQEVIGIDCVPDRLNLAKNKLGIKVLNYKEVNVVKELLQMYPDGVDVGIECVGYEYPCTLTHKVERALSLETDTADIITEIFTCVRPFGRVSIVGVYTGTANHFPIGMLMEKGLTVTSGQCPSQKYWKMALEKIQSGELDPTFILTHEKPLTEGPELYKRFHDRNDGVIKVLMRPQA